MKSTRYLMSSLFAALLSSLLLFSSPAFAHCADAGDDGGPSSEIFDHND